MSMKRRVKRLVKKCKRPNCVDRRGRLAVALHDAVCQRQRAEAAEAALATLKRDHEQMRQVCAKELRASAQEWRAKEDARIQADIEARASESWCSLGIGLHRHGD